MQPFSKKTTEVSSSMAHAAGGGASPASAKGPATSYGSGRPEPARPNLGQASLDRIGNTPLLRLSRLTKDLPGREILGKAEWLNPGGSVKDRAAANIVAQARANGQFTPGKTLLDSTSGNTGIA